MWLFSEIPPEYHGVIWTQGYSIENDLYAGANLEKLLSADEAAEHQQVMDSIIEWFAFEVEEYLEEREAQVATGCNEIVPIGETEINQDFRSRRGFHPPNRKLHQQIKDGYQLQLRGKLLFQMLSRFLNAGNRRPKHSNLALYEIAFKMTPSHEFMHQLIGKIERIIAQHAPPTRSP